MLFYFAHSSSQYENKIATTSSDEEDGDEIRMIYDAFEPRIADVLAHIDDGTKADIENELTETFDKHELVDIREKIFSLVKEKAARCLSQPNAGGIFKGKCTFDTHGDPRIAARQVSQWEAVNRRAEHKLASDCIDFLTFVLRNDEPFPTKLVKESSFESSLKEVVVPTALRSSLQKDLSRSNGDIEVEIVAHEGASGSAVITVTPAVADDSTTAKTASGTYVCSVCKTEKRETACSATSTEDLPPPCVKTPGKKEMATQTSEDAYVNRDEFEYGMDYLERIANESKDKVSQFNRWKDSIERRVAEIEKGNYTPLRLSQWKSDMGSRMTALEVGYSNIRKCDSGPDSQPDRNEPPVDAVSQRARVDVVCESVWEDAEEMDTEIIPDVSITAQRQETVCPPVSEGEKTLTFSDDIATDNPYSPLMQEPPVAKTGVRGDGENPRPQRGRGIRSRRGRGGRAPQSTTNAANSVSDGAHTPKPGRSDEAQPRNKSKAPASSLSSGNKAVVEKGKAGKQASLTSNQPAKPSGSQVRRDESSAQSVSNKDNRLISKRTVNDQGKAGTGRVAAPDKGKAGTEKVTASDKGRAIASSMSKKGEKGMPAAKKLHVTIDVSSSASGDDDETPTRSHDGDDTSDTDTAGNSQEGESASANADVSATSDSADSYAGAAARGRWQKPKNKKRKWGKKNVPVLRSSAEVSYKELYVQELDYTQSSGREDFEDMVYAFCMSRGVKPIDLSMIPVRGTRLKAGCKVTVNAADYKQTSKHEFWPRGAEVRDWVFRPKKAGNDSDDSDVTDRE